jgi:hypothetical protein
MADGQRLDLLPAGLLSRRRVEGRIAIESVGAQPVDAAGVGRAEGPRVLDRQQGLADTAQPRDLDQEIAIIMGRC